MLSRKLLGRPAKPVFGSSRFADHGYLIHEFLSPLRNSRSDPYGGSFETRTRMLREVVSAVRRVWPERAPLFVRISATDRVDGGWDIQQSVELARPLKPLGADLIDCSSGGNVPTGEDSAWSRLSNAVCRADPARSQHYDRRGRDDHVVKARTRLSRRRGSCARKPRGINEIGPELVFRGAHH